jgi:hypothetical protein
MTPGAVLTALGALLASLLFFGPVHFGANVILDLNTFISACFLVVVGTQVMTFGAVFNTMRLSQVCCRKVAGRNSCLITSAPTEWCYCPLSSC